MEKEKVLLIEDVQGAIENIQKFYKEYYPKLVELDIITNLKDAEEKIQDITSNKILGTYNYILMDGRLHGDFTDTLIIALLQQEDVPPIISVSASPEQAERYQLPHIQKGFFEHIATALYSVLLGDEIQLKDSTMRFEDLHINGLIDHTTFKNRTDNRGYRKAMTKRLLPKIIQQTHGEINKEEVIINNTKKEVGILKKIIQIFSKNS